MGDEIAEAITEYQARSIFVLADCSTVQVGRKGGTVTVVAGGTVDTDRQLLQCHARS